MTNAARKILTDALALPDEEREVLLLELQASFEPDDEWEAEWAAECERRLDDVKAGRSNAVPWEEARDRIRARLRAR